MLKELDKRNENKQMAYLEVSLYKWKNANWKAAYIYIYVYIDIFIYLQALFLISSIAELCLRYHNLCFECFTVALLNVIETLPCEAIGALKKSQSIVLNMRLRVLVEYELYWEWIKIRLQLQRGTKRAKGDAFAW